MMGLIDRCREIETEAVLIWFHGTRTLGAVILTPLAIYMGWIYSIAFLSILSLITYVASEAGTFQAGWSARREAKRLREEEPKHESQGVTK